MRERLSANSAYLVRLFFTIIIQLVLPECHYYSVPGLVPVGAYLSSFRLADRYYPQWQYGQHDLSYYGYILYMQDQSLFSQIPSLCRLAT